MKMTVDESDTLEYYCESIAGIVVAAYLCDIFAVANYQMLHFVYNHNMDCSDHNPEIGDYHSHLSH